MALFYQNFGLKRLMTSEVLRHGQTGSSPVTNPSYTSANVKTGFDAVTMIEPDPGADKMAPHDPHSCFSIPPTMDALHAENDIGLLERMTPINQATSQYLGDLVLRQYLGLENGLFSAYPCGQRTRLVTGSNQEAWYRSAFKEKATAWSEPYVDPVSSRTVMAVSYPITGEDESPIGVSSLLVPLNSLLEQVYFISDLPAGTIPYLCTLAIQSATGQVGAKISASMEQTKNLASVQNTNQRPRWLVSSDKTEFRAMLEDIARRQYRVREMPFKGRMSFWAYGPLLHQGTAFVFIVPRDQVLNPENDPLLESIRERLVKVENFTAGFLIILILVTAVAAFRFSRTVTKPLAEISTAAQKLADGDFEARVSISSRDEFGHLERIFNSVGHRLKEHYRMRRSLEVAEEIQQNLLPAVPPELPGLEIYGMTLFSDETGGDYFDYLCVDEVNQEKLCIVVGDVAGHGIPSALFMATVRGFLRLRATMPGTLGNIVSDVNREFIKDAEDSGQFMTMFLARINRDANRIDWVRAGHDPAILYDPDTDSFSSLNEGQGLPLGVAKNAVYEASSCHIKPGQILIMGTDGIWEARNSRGELFGKDRLQQVVHANSRESARTILLSVLDAVEEFRGKGVQEDDLTLVIVRITNR
jgi:sigma-B regulation protein RsbU (phosphoserine phosphatase)